MAESSRDQEQPRPMPAPAQPAEAERMRQAAREAATAQARPATETMPGGRYETTDGRTVDAGGEEIKG